MYKTILEKLKELSNDKVFVYRFKFYLVFSSILMSISLFIQFEMLEAAASNQLLKLQINHEYMAELRHKMQMFIQTGEFHYIQDHPIVAIIALGLGVMFITVSYEYHNKKY
jgi:hypothetical protein